MWQVSDFIQDDYVDYRVYDGFDCKEGAEDITVEMNDNTNDGDVYLYTTGVRADAGTVGNPLRDMRLFLNIQSETISKFNKIYKEEMVGGQLFANIDFCVRFSLWTQKSDQPDAIEVNFHEVLVSFKADLTDGFEVADIAVTNKDKTQETANIACEVTGYECEKGSNAPLANPGYLR
jgi:hypothetical protein